MNSELAQFRFYQSRSDVLRGGQAPRFWRGELSREIDQLTTVLRVCGWVKLLVEVRPLFSEQPLFGNCLAELTSRDVSQPAATDSTESRKNSMRPPVSESRNPKVNQRTTSSIRRRIPENDKPTVSVTRGVVPVSSERHDERDVSQLPLQVEASFLKRIAGTFVDTPSQRQDAPNLSWRVPRRRSVAPSPF